MIRKIAIAMALASATCAVAEQNQMDDSLALMGFSKGKVAAAAPSAPMMESGMALENASPGSTILKSARYETGDRWDFSFNLAFNEYYATQEGIEVAVLSSTDLRRPVVDLDFEFKPGFQLGFTLNTPYDKWTLAGEYLWFRSSVSESKTATGADSYISSFVGEALTAGAFTSFRAAWNLGIDLADLAVSRPYYAGMKWTFAPLFGLRGGSIRQYLTIKGPNTDGNFDRGVLKANSWLIGPRAGMQANWLLGMGFSFFGDVACSVLYSRYTSASVKNTRSTGVLSKATNDDSSSLSPNVDAGIGVRWGTYSTCRKYYFDLSAAYNFSAFFSQNQMQAVNGVAVAYASNNPGTLYLQGISIATTFLF